MKPARFVLVCTALACLASLLLGYDIGVMSAALQFVEVEFDLSVAQQELVVAGLNLAAMAGSPFAGWLSDTLGRRRALFASAMVFAAGAILMGLAQDFYSLFAGRIVTGIGTGCGLVLAPLYAAELSPAKVRGRLVSLAEILINVGILLGYVAGFIFAHTLDESLAWRMMLGVGAVPAFVLAGVSIWLPESPRWLLGRAMKLRSRAGQHDRLEEGDRRWRWRKCWPWGRRAAREETLLGDAAGSEPGDAGGVDRSADNLEQRALMVLLKSSELRDEAEERMEEIREILMQEEELKARGWGELVATSHLRWLMFVGIGISFFQQASGIEAAVYYTPKMLTMAGITDTTAKLGATVAVGFAKTTCTVIASLLLDKVGRRPLLLASSGGLAVSLAWIGTCFALSPENEGDPEPFFGSPEQRAVGTLAGQIVYVMAFAAGWGPVCWLIVSEIFPLNVRGRAMSISAATNRLVSGTTALVFLSLIEAMTAAGTYFLFMTIAVVGLAWSWRFVPETAGRTLEQLEAELGGPKFDHQVAELTVESDEGSDVDNRIP
jgi:MFS family permease